jgi:U32 family peptidase
MKELLYSYMIYSDQDVQNHIELASKTSSVSSIFILGTKALSRVSNMDWDQTISCAQKFKKNTNAKVYLQWDILMTDSLFTGVCAQLNGRWDELVQNFDGIRVQDSGALVWLKEKSYPGSVHFICENGNHNLRGLLSWYNFWPEKISRLVLSPEFTATTLKELKEQIPCEIEVLAAGNILLFYTPRHLVSPLYENDSNLKEEEKLEEFRVFGTSEESPHKGFPIIENNHGTFMFNTKELFILDEEKQIEDLDELHFRVDYPIEELDLIQLELFKERKWKNFQESRKATQTKGFFRSNKTDVLFKKLKNHRLQDRGSHYIGDVVDVKKKKHIAILVKGQNLTLKAGDEIKLLSPEGREKVVPLNYLKDADQNVMDCASTGQIFFIPHVGGISVRTMVFREL